MSLDFGIFLTAFGNGYRMMTDPETGKALRKEEFCRELLCAISSNEGIVKYIDGICDATHKRDLTAFQAFYRVGKQRRSLHPIAEQMINSGSLNEAKFKGFLKDYSRHFSKEKMLVNFQKNLPTTSEASLFDDITAGFVQILTEEAAKPDNRRKSLASVSVTTSNAAAVNVQNGNPPPGSPIKEIDDMLAELTVIGREIAKYSKTDMFGLDLADDAEREVRRKLKARLQEKLTKLKDLASSLLHSGNHQNTSCFTEIFTLVQSLEDKDFIRSEFEFRAVSQNNAHVHRLLDILSELQDKTD